MKVLKSALTALATLSVVLAQAVIPAAAPIAVPGALPAALQEAGVVHFTAAGDYSSSAAALSVFDQINTISPDLHLALGDLGYGTTGQEQLWCDTVTDAVGAGFPFQLVSGNHESDGQNGNINDFSACLPNQLPGLVGTYGRQWYVDVPAENPLVRFVMISPNLSFPGGSWSYNVGTPRYNWTAAAIDGARSAHIPWVVAGMHYPCLSVGDYACSPGADITNLLLNRKVDLVLGGHEHLYQRTRQLASGVAGCATLVPGTYTAACVADPDSTMVKGAGTVFTTAGTGGVALRDVNMNDSEAGYFAATSGLNSNPTFGALNLTLKQDSLTATFRRASGGTFADDFSITAGAPPANTPPTASFTNSCTGMSCSFDASASADGDGTVAQSAWDFGDGSTGSGTTVQHSFAAAGTYPVRLTVTDNDGATGTLLRSITVTAAATALARDTFGRTVTSGFGAAEIGGNWSVARAVDASVSGGVGRLRLPTPGTSNTVLLNAVSSNSTDLQLVLGTDKPASGSGLYLSTIVRSVAGAGQYRVKAIVAANGQVKLQTIRASATGVETVLQTPVTVPGVTYAVGDGLQMRVQATGTSPTTIRAKLWERGTSEPATWQASATDTTAGLQVAGGVGLFAYVSGSATNTPLVITLDDVEVVKAG
ncbi:PKD domain-containing protein [Paeniglutamicibacter sp. Y32M11]|uniref:PKD domain-containing protein n=1 Tax=Paeniglutamicibacter sp. Y32M11 TaxID=2853258 RepID=UPI00210251B9|nr:PKD domain-containing protein [Paeniglutamicibacter sp. Y32M11]